MYLKSNLDITKIFLNSGMAEHIRLTFVIAGVPYEETIYTAFEWPETKGSEYLFLISVNI